MEMVDKVLIERIKEKYLNVTGFTGLKTGFKGIDSLTGGFANGQLIVLGGRPGMGKTTFACSLIDNICLNDNKSCILFSSEMTKKQTIDRLMQIHSNIKYHERDPDEIADRLINSAAVMEKANLWVDDGNVATGEDFIESCREIGKQKRIDLVIVDDLQLFVCKTKSLDRHYMELKRLAEELNCPVVAFSKVNRTVENRTNHMPDISDLQDAKTAYRYADEILFLYRDAYYDPDADRSKAVIKLAKHDHLWNMNISMRFDTEVFAFRDDG